MQKLNEPIIWKLDSELAFILITEVDWADMKHDILVGKGKKYDYEDGFITESKEHFEIQFSLSVDGYSEVSERECEPWLGT